MLNKFIFKYLIKKQFKKLFFNLSKYIISNECQYEKLYNRFFNKPQILNLSKYQFLLRFDLIDVKTDKILKLILSIRSNQFNSNFNENIFVCQYYIIRNKHYFDDKSIDMFFEDIHFKKLLLLNKHLYNFNDNIQNYINEDKKMILDYFDFKGLYYVK